ncbi:MAG: tRNA (adenosine(37)-N6)-threonylcarbamoyltransferase complex ATPase subunit type 1 TsaE [Rhodoglobus sp.]
MEALGATIAAQLRAGDLVLLNGELGAGKTTLTRGIGAALGVRGSVQSPTFVLARTHPGPVAPLVHVDAYRLGSALELDDLDIDFAASIVVVEWGAGLLDGRTEDWLSVDIVRPRGAPVGEAAEARSGSESGGPEVPPVRDGLETGDDNDQPRTVIITGHGPRWADLGWLPVG